jgi:IPT/TIG domain
MKDQLIGRTARRLTLAAALALAALAVGAGTAQAVIVTNVDGHRLSLELAPGRSIAAARPSSKPAKPLNSKNVTYHGGPVMASNTNYAIYWDPSGGAAFPAGYTSGIDRWFEDLAHDSGGMLNTDSLLVQYGANYSSHFAGALVDTDPYPGNGCKAAEQCLTDEQLQTELRSFIQARALPEDLEHMYFLITPQGLESCVDGTGKSCSVGAKGGDYCAYHSYMELAGGGLIIYADIPYTVGLGCGDESNKPNGSPSDEALAGGITHEHAEGVTDPTLKAWKDSKENEIADKCRGRGEATEYGTALGEVNGSKYNEVLDGDFYWYQQVWSNEAESCQQRELEVPTIKKMKPKKGPTTGDTEVTITGTGFTPSASVSFGGTAALHVVVESGTTLVATSPAHAAEVVDVSVTTGGGTSAATKKDHFKYKAAK